MKRETQIGFIGTGTIGKPIALRLVAEYPNLTVFDLDTNATSDLLEQGAKRAASVAEIARGCEIVFASLPGPAQIEAVMLGEDGLLANTRNISTIVDLSTNALKLNRELSKQAASQNIHYLDAPVSGGKVAAEKGTLSVMVGGDKSAFAAVSPLLESFGNHINYMGPSGAGTLTKLINNQIFLSASVLVQEGFVMGAKAGMDPNDLLNVLNASSAAPMVERASLVLSKNFDMDIFALEIAAKDVAVALESANELGASMPLTKAASDVYTQALDLGLAKKDFFATVKVLEQAANVEVPPLNVAKGKRT
ncbi:MAG: NAD(P)-dependent oxidoreductase [Gammaproteobacteria bacterium]